MTAHDPHSRPDRFDPERFNPERFDLQRLAEPASHVARPPAAEIRRRGMLRRRHRMVAVAVSAAAGALLTTGVAFSATGAFNGMPWWNPNATQSPSRAVPPVLGSPSNPPLPSGPVTTSGGSGQVLSQPTWDNVPSTEEIWHRVPGDLTVVDEEEGELIKFSPSACTYDQSAIGARTLLLRSFRATEPDQTFTQRALVMGFDSTEDAARARAVITGWYRTCGEISRKGGLHNAESSGGIAVSLAGVTAAEMGVMSWSDDAAGVQGNFEDGLLIQKGNRLVWLVSTVGGISEHHCDTAPNGPIGIMCAVNRQAEEVAALL